MARCPHLEYDDRGPCESQGNYYCDICGKELSDSEVKDKCKTDYGDQYEECPIYKNN